jgi:DNA-binding CsgD family transcriptional regulator
MNDIVWNKIMLAEFRDLACLSDTENLVLQDWADGKSIVNTAVMRNISTRQVDTIRNQIRKKYDAVQIYTPLLPPRKDK